LPGHAQENPSLFHPGKPYDKIESPSELRGWLGVDRLAGRRPGPGKLAINPDSIRAIIRRSIGK
jgi:hypothetical protein